MMSNKAWQRHGCYRLGSAQYFNMPLESALPGCDDDWNSLDHFYPTTDTHRSEFSRIILTTKQSTIDNSSESFKLSQNTLPKETRSLVRLFLLVAKLMMLILHTRLLAPKVLRDYCSAGPMGVTGVSCGVFRSPNGRSCFSSSFSSVSGLSCSISSRP
ncbi:hypothetical protein C8R48DRAFT_409888 [Suillus tomentosus]|nr:hypothetical protein C8R48DRAFT_409888 [Suillus tomentosus]